MSDLQLPSVILLAVGQPSRYQVQLVFRIRLSDDLLVVPVFESTWPGTIPADPEAKLNASDIP